MEGRTILLLITILSVPPNRYSVSISSVSVSDLLHTVPARHGPIRFDARHTDRAWNKQTNSGIRKKKTRTPLKQKTNVDLYKKEGEPFVLKKAWCFWLGCTNFKYYKHCRTVLKPFCPPVLIPPKQKEENCYPGWASVVGGCYRIVNVATFNQSRNICEGDTISLVEISHKFEQKYLSEFYNDSLINGWVWLGAQKTQEDEWRWIDSGEKINFNLWDSGEPNNAKKDENCIIWDGNESLKAVRCNLTDPNFKAICERKEPTIDMESVTTVDPESVTDGPTIEPPEDCNCGIPKRKLRIVGGKTTEKHEYPWQVALVFAYDNDNTPFCSGSLISRETVLTAAHCTQEYRAKDISVVIGEHNVTDDSDGQRRMKVKQIIQHNSYNAETIDNDISLLILTKPVKWKWKPICLPNQSTNYENVKGIVSGWGGLEYNGLNSDILLETEVMTMTNKECTENKSYNSSEITSNMICAAGDRKDACHGDSGGPLITLETGGYYSVIGVVSWGVGCGDQEYPGVYSRVANQLSWITDKMVGQTCPIPQQTSGNLDFHWSSQQSNIWWDNQCPNLGNEPAGQTLKTCKELCEKKTGCTAINFNAVNRWCTLRGCTLPVPAPVSHTPNYVGYFMIMVVDGEWSEWGAFGPCSVTCGNGTKTRERRCDSPAPANGGEDCSGPNQETEVCNDGDCPACPEIDIDYSGNDITFVRNIPNWQSCANSCSELAGCSHWTWVTPDYNGPEGTRVRNFCLRKSGGNGRRSMSGLISGLSICQEKLWRDDGRCGASYPLPSGRPGQCDPAADANEKGPCCSPGGFCGNSDQHCKCSSCVNYAGSIWTQSSDEDCWGGCGSKGGLCPSVCGDNGYCCREGYDDCPPQAAAEASPNHHTCVTEIPSHGGTLISSRASSQLESSEHCWLPGNAVCIWGPQFAIDGQLRTSYGKIFHSNTENYPWLEVEMSHSTKIHNVTIFNRPDGSGEQFKNAEIRAGMSRVPDGTTGQLLNINTVCGIYQGPGTNNEEMLISCASPIMAKFVTVQLKDNGASLQINEIKINTIG